jgi:hypothetical protein
MGWAISPNSQAISLHKQISGKPKETAGVFEVVSIQLDIVVNWVLKL